MKRIIMFLIVISAVMLITTTASATPSPGSIKWDIQSNGPAVPAQQMSPTQAYNYMKVNGATVAPGLTLRQAVGLDSSPRPMGQPAINNAPVGVTPPVTSLQRYSSSKKGRHLAYTYGTVYCWGPGVTRSHQWGSSFFFGLEANLYDHATWCGHYGYSLTSWSHTVTQGGQYCSPAGTSKWNSYYYSGSPIVKVMDWGTWNCSYGISLGSAQHQMELSYNSYGADWVDWTSG